ncbi:peptide ligase PGM1-related protein [Leptolyngbya sp. AN02str]|uniref:peptide ligase PGM1-related protein n=1 Tax=Leptolyngbya sp. AN02str TaxID=3423363 RepID=UPI003D31C07C
MPSTVEIDRFQALQSQLRDRWCSIDEFDRRELDIIVIPSLSLDRQELQKIKGVHHYEERLLFSLIRLRNPGTRLIYVTSQPLNPLIVDYYLNLLPDVPYPDARDRLILFSTDDASTKPLTQKILERPRLIERLRKAIRTDCAFMTCFNSTQIEKELSLQLDLPLLALDPDLLRWGTKSGSREVFAEANVPHPDGCLEVWDAADLATATAELWERQPNLKRMVVKLNEGFSGQGNALLKLDALQSVAPERASTVERAEAIAHAFEHLSFQCDTETWAHFSSRIPDLGAIVEAFIEGEEKRSPSVQGRISPMGDVEILSTHDQILGGPDGQIFLGCSFPADDSYRQQLQEYGLAVGKVLAAKGVIERYSVDFMAVRSSNHDSWNLQAIEINIRKGGTTHPHMTLKLLTGGHYDRQSGCFLNQRGEAKYYVATDNLQSDRYIGLLPNDLMEIVARHRLHFSRSSETGSVFHIMGCLSEYGKLGLLSIGNSPEEADTIYKHVIQVLDDETQMHTQHPFHPVYLSSTHSSTHGD